MKNKLLIYFLALFMGFCLIFSPHITFNVSAALPITICDFDDVASGLDDFTSGYFVGHSSGQVNRFETHSSGDLSAPNSLAISDNGAGSLNLTTNISYVGAINFSFIGTDIAGENYGYWYIDFYNDGVKYIDMEIYLYDAGADFIKWTDVGAGLSTVYTTASIETARLYIVITHNGTNQFNIKVLNASYVEVANADYAGCYAGAWTTFDRIVFPECSVSDSDDVDCYFDNFIIDTTYSLPGEPPEGYIGINCFNETSGENITDFNVLFVNQEGDTYYDYLVDNTWVVWGDLLPQGECICTVSKTGYYPRSYVLDVEDGYFVIDGVTYTEVILNAYLPSINLSALYYIQVIDEYLYPVEDASVRIQGWCGETEYKNVSITKTDGYGMTNVYLCWGREYQVTISKTGFVNKTESWIPDPSQYGINYPKIFRIYHIGYNLTPEYDPWDYIVFQGWMYNNNTIKVNYEDVVLNGTINATFYTYEINGTSLGSVLISTNNTTNNTFTFWIYDINSSRHHRVYLYLNHTILGYIILHIDLSLTNITDNINETDIEDKITDVFGPFDLGYVNFFFVFLPAIFLLVIPGHFHPGIGILSAGLWLGFGSLYFGLPSIITILAPFLMMIGTLLMIVKGGASKL